MMTRKKRTRDEDEGRNDQPPVVREQTLYQAYAGSAQKTRPV
jgi:hypothetical protein